ncbi:MAG: ISNCY family transposase [bacterium]
MVNSLAIPPMTLITMSAKEIDKFQIIKKLISKHINGTEAAGLLHLTVRQIRRLKSKVKRFGAQGLVHGNRGRESHNKINEKEKKKIIALLNKHYSDFGPTFANEKLLENHKIDRDSKTIRQIMIGEKLWKPKLKKQASEHRAWRERRSCYGELIQFDGSYEHWLEDRGNTGEICLLAAIDDATGRIVEAKFASDEGVFPVFGFWLQYLLKHGKPRNIYLDKFSTYKMGQQVALENHDLKTQFQRALDELKIEPIFANSPQAKGRVERLFKTLQDRLIKEMRLLNLNNVEEANLFLRKVFIPLFNKRFAVQPRNETNLHTALNVKEQKELKNIFSRQTKRTVQNDFTFSFNNQWYQLTKGQPATICKKDEVIVEEHLDSSVHIRLRGKYLNYELLPARPKKASNDLDWIIPKRSTAHVPPANHPWRKQFIQTKEIAKVGHF